MYTALYRTERPETFDEILGQEHIVKILKNQVATGTVGHAYLFAGTRGTGKTSTARILAKAVNCTGEGYLTRLAVSEGEEVEREVRKYGCLGLKPYLTNCPPYIPPNEIRIFDFLPPEHLEAADRNGWIVMLHIPRSGRLRDPVNLAQLLEIEKRYPNIKLIVAHIGRAYSKQDIGDAFDLLGRTERMLFDFTANLCDDAIRACIKAVGCGRLMFGSDMPIAIMRMYRITDPVTGFYRNVVPRGLYGDVSGDPHMLESDETNITLMIYEQLRALKRVAANLHLTDAQIEKILYGNAKDLLESVK